MKLNLIASIPLRPVIERMLPASPHRLEPAYLPAARADWPAFLRERTARAEGFDALLLADGAELLDGEGLLAGSVPLVLPRVHNCVSLLLGGAARYRSLFGLHGGELCWRVPLCAEELFFTPRADCSALCYLADTSLGLPDEGIEARVAARKNGWDYFSEEIDLSLLERLLAGSWEGGDFVTLPAGGRAVPTYTQELFRAE
ncbi:hypothetical protein [uncultured Anaerotruncus sp.]|uniref:hypothetical protein n=1 Tax=uncultured Anaerotruncus sp. TaxID=905011 RepID=UPI00280B1EF4|nr:hypothetical protein [uncultured Anaerotruncus sp.]